MPPEGFESDAQCIAESWFPPMLQLRDRVPHEMTVEEYLDSNIEGHTELLGGIVYDVSPKNAPHGLAVRRLIKAFRVLGDEYSLSVQDPIAVAGWTGKHAPAIDVAVIAEGTYDKIPSAADSAAFIEVSDTTLLPTCRERYN